MNVSSCSCKYRRMMIGILLILLCVTLYLCACETAPTPEGNTDIPVTVADTVATDPAFAPGDSPATEAPETENVPVEIPPAGALTLAPAPETVSPETGGNQPSADDLDPAAAYEQLVITSVYAAGRVAGKGVCDASYIELYNNSDHDIPLAGAALYISSAGAPYTEIDFDFGQVISAHANYLLRLADAGGVTQPVLTVEWYDAIWPVVLEPDDLRLVLGVAGCVPDETVPLADVPGLFSYLSAHPLDQEDTYHALGRLTPEKMARKKADTHKADYQTIDLVKSSYTVLSQISPRTSDGRVNTTVHSRIDEVVFSAVGGVYAEGFDLTMTAPEGYTIYFTVNGLDPRTGSFDTADGIMTYTTPLHLNDTTDMAWGQLTKAAGRYLGGTYYPLASSFPGGACIRAYAVRESDGAVTPMTTQTYFIGSLFSEWNMDMVNVSVIPDEFIGRDGIYLCATSVHEHIAAYVEFISPAGRQVFAGWSEIAMNGRGSLGMRQKSFRVLLKSSPDGVTGVEENLNTLNYDLFGAYANRTPDGERVTWYRHILLRNGGGDNSGCTISRSHIGDAYIQRIDRFLIPDDMAYAPVMVFVNGEFFGLFNARDRLDTKYFTAKYSFPEEDFSMLECPYPLTYGWNVDYMAAYGDPAQADEFNDLVRFLKTHNMAEQANYDYAAERLDIDGLIDFFCAQIYLCCSDWPGNNIKIWRNTNPDNDHLDTRWHFCIVDTDHGVGLNSRLDTNLFGVINDGSIMGAVVNHLMQNPDFRTKFIRRFVWCTEVYFAPERMLSELDILVGHIQPVMQLQLDRWRVTDGSQTTYDIWWSYIEVIRNFVSNRQPYAKAQCQAWAGISDADWARYRREAIARWGETVE